MEHVAPAGLEYPTGVHLGAGANEAHSSGVSWAAILGGAFVAAALSVILLALGAGLGLSAVSPWARTGATASEMAAGTIIWLILMQIAACGIGGYIAGRLRTKWVNVHTDEVFFRDTAHGFLVWAVGLVISASFLASAGGSLIGGAARAGATAATVAAGATGAAAAVPVNASRADGATDSNAYFVDSMLRTDNPAPSAATGASGAGGMAISDTELSSRSDPALKSELGRIFSRGLTQSDFPAADRTYMAKRIAARTGMSQADAEKRVDDIVNQAKQAEADARQKADEARKEAAHGLLWIFVSLLIGAFCASFAATIGGRQRDHLPTMPARTVPVATPAL